MREPKPIDHPIAESLAYLIVATLAALVIAHAAQAPHDPISPDFHVAEASR